jgi:hypothetical protein
VVANLQFCCEFQEKWESLYLCTNALSNASSGTAHERLPAHHAGNRNVDIQVSYEDPGLVRFRFRAQLSELNGRVAIYFSRYGLLMLENKSDVVLSTSHIKRFLELVALRLKRKRLAF